MQPPTSCPKCKGVMEVGSVPAWSARGGWDAPRWISGALPGRTIFGGMRLGDRETYAIMTFRCAACGYLESYAPAGERA